METLNCTVATGKYCLVEFTGKPSRCYACGDPVCKNCSQILRYHKHTCRICHTCMETQNIANADYLITRQLYEIANASLEGFEQFWHTQGALKYV